MLEKYTSTFVIKPTTNAGINYRVITAAITVTSGTVTLQHGGEGNWVNTEDPYTESTVKSFVQTKNMPIRLLISGVATVTVG